MLKNRASNQTNRKHRDDHQRDDQKQQQQQQHYHRHQQVFKNKKLPKQRNPVTQLKILHCTFVVFVSYHQLKSCSFLHIIK